MKFAKNFMRVAMMAFAVVAMGSCTPAGPDDGGAGTQQPTAVTFTVAATEVGETTATVSVSHDGNAENTWYGFLTTDVKTAALTLAYNKIAEVKVEDLLTGTTATINLTDLELATEYKYVVFGMNADGSFYGTPGEAKFTTGDGRSMSVNEAWTVEYVGNLTSQESGEVAQNCVNITATDENPYYLVSFTPEEWAAVQTDLYGYVEGLIAEMKVVLPQLNDYYGTDYTFEEAFLYAGSNTLVLGELNPGKYVAVLLGITADQKVSRLYATSAEFEVVEEDPTPEYSAWIGNWTVSGAGEVWSDTAGEDGKGGFVAGDIAFDIAISKGVNNKWYLVDGWAGVTGLPFAADYYAQYDALAIFADVIASGVEFDDGSTGTIYLLAEYLEAGTAKIGTGLEVYIMKDESGNMVVVGGDYSNYDLTITGLNLYVQFDDDTSGYVYLISDMAVNLPLTMAPAAAAPAEVMGLTKPMYEGKEIRHNFKKIFEFYKAGARKSNALLNF